MKPTTLLCISLLLAACAEDDSGGQCTSQIASMRSTYGFLADSAPTRIQSGGNTSLTYFYSSQGVAKNFSYGPAFDGCSVSTYSFSPF